MTERDRSVTGYQAQNAVLVASLLDRDGNPGSSLRDSFVAAATAGLSPAAALRDGLDVLVAFGFVMKDGDFYRPAPALALLRSTDAHEAQSILNAIANASEDEALGSLREEVGLVAELHVVQACRDELTDLSRTDLADLVVQVSVISDRYGYDVSAPTIGSHARHLEVKGTREVRGGLFRFFLTRHEYTVGRSDPQWWALVACKVGKRGAGEGGMGAKPGGAVLPETATEWEVEVLGHCRADVLAPFVPQDANGRWTEALISLPRHLLAPGLPTPIP